MNLLLSWSGQRSRDVAAALREWLPLVIQSIEPWMSADDIPAGSRWLQEVGDTLSRVRIGIVCLTSENLDAPWILFEAGALSNAIGQSLVCPYLLDIAAGDIRFPLAQFQATVADREQTRALLDSINRAIKPENPLATHVLDTSFNTFWPLLETRLREIRKQSPDYGASAVPKRSDGEKLDEILSATREISRRQPPTGIVQRLDELLSLVRAIPRSPPVPSVDQPSTSADAMNRSRQEDLDRIEGRCPRCHGTGLKPGYEEECPSCTDGRIAPVADESTSDDSLTP